VPKRKVFQQSSEERRTKTRQVKITDDTELEFAYVHEFHFAMCTLVPNKVSAESLGSSWELEKKDTLLERHSSHFDRDLLLYNQAKVLLPLSENTAKKEMPVHMSV
jgi:hypothetical protein